MKIRCGSNIYNPSFQKGQTTLYSDFDGTLLAQPLHDIYQGDNAKKQASVNNFNKYFSEIQEFIDSTKGKFEIIITTGRRLFGDRKDGFEPTYQKMREEGIQLPKIKSIITTSGGDVYNFGENGIIERTPDPQKASLIKQASGWDNEQIIKTLDKIAEETQTAYDFVNTRGSYKLSIRVSDPAKIESFYKRLVKELEGKMTVKAKVGDVKVALTEDLYTKMMGIKLEPRVDGHTLHKDFDTRIALKEAIKNGDFVIVAGDADNDKEALNIFRYITQPKEYKPPKSVGDITEDYIRSVRDEIESLPLKILFIRPKSGEVDTKMLTLSNFMQKTAELFPKKVQIVEQTQVGENNYFLDAIKNAIQEFTENGANSAIKTTNSIGKTFTGALTLFASMTALGVGIAKLENNKKQEQK